MVDLFLGEASTPIQLQLLINLHTNLWCWSPQRWSAWRRGRCKLASDTPVWRLYTTE